MKKLNILKGKKADSELEPALRKKEKR